MMEYLHEQRTLLRDPRSRLLGCCPPRRIICSVPSPVPNATCSLPKSFTQLAPVESISPEQEHWLGEAIVAETQQNWRLVDDPQVLALPLSILSRFTSLLPEPRMEVRLSVVDLPAVNAFAMPGNRIYVTRQAIAFLRDEDELAALLAHELAHVASRHSARTLSLLFDRILDVKALGDREQTTGLYHKLSSQLLIKAPQALRVTRDRLKTETAADELAVYLLAATGYRVESFADMFDRLAGTQGRTGNAFADLFGVTSDEAKRLRLMVKGAARMPPDCIRTPAGSKPMPFPEWQSLVAEWRGGHDPGETIGLVSKGLLNPPLRVDLTRLLFSPDGRYLLAQDDMGLSLLTVQPLAFAFRIDVPDALDAQFTPDSSAIVFRDMNQHIERWSIKERARTVSRTVSRRNQCRQALLSPDGAKLACVSGTGEVELIDTSDGTVVWKSETLGKRPMAMHPIIQLMGLGVSAFDVRASVQMAFTPDGSYWLAASNLFGDGEAVIWDTRAARSVPLENSLKLMKQRGFSLLGSGSVLIPPQRQAGESLIVSFPSGVEIDRISLPVARQQAATQKGYLIMRPFMNFATAIVDLKSKEAVKGLKGTAVDVFGDSFAAERVDGEVGLYRLNSSQPFATVELPDVAAGSFASNAFSPGLKYLALSGRVRAHVWDLESARRVASLNRLQSPSLGDDAKLRVVMSAGAKEPPSLWIIDWAAGKASRGQSFSGMSPTLCGPVVIQLSGEGSFALEGLKPDTGQQVWRLGFEQGGPALIQFDCSHSSVSMAWQLDSSAGRSALKSSPALNAQKKLAETLPMTWLVRRLSLDGGQLVDEYVVGSKTLLAKVNMQGDWVVVQDASNMVHAVGKKTGQMVLRAFGRLLAQSDDGRYLLLKTVGPRMQLIDLSGSTSTRELAAASEPVLGCFDASGKRIIVVTNRQEIFETKIAP